jgi:pilus assembly protein Flp/PilA
MAKIRTAFSMVIAGDEGATMVEYALMIAFIALVCVAAVTALGTSLLPGFQSVTTAL